MKPSPSEPSPPGAWPESRWFALVCLVLALGTLALYWPITHYPFVEFDDMAYVVDNPHVNTGLSTTNLVWAFTTFEQANWHPLTWVSHQLDCTLFGVEAGGSHLVNLLYHVANTLLLFLFLRSATGAFWRSALVAALFAWHPMHVESVAWASERKDVLSTFFWLLTMLVYLVYARRAGGNHAPAGAARPPGRAGTAGCYLAALALCACGLLSKPMVVTLPFVLLLLDFWPLNRISGLAFHGAGAAAGGCRPVSWGRVVLEKIPFLALAIGGSVSTFLAQSGGGAVSKLELSERLANVALAYVRYVAKLIWPSDLVILYPRPPHWPVVLALAALALVTVWTLLCAWNWRKKPYLAAGWFWFLGTLVPTIGFIQVGAQAMADRYTYIPSIGFFIVAVWGATELLSRSAIKKTVLAVAAGALLLGYASAAFSQIALWHNSITLFRHAVEVTTDNYAAENALGKAYERAGQDAYALACYQQAVKTEPRFPQSQFNLAMALLAANRPEEALEHLQVTAAIDPRDADVQFDLGIYFSQRNGWTNAAICFSNSVAIRPGFARAQQALGGALSNLGQASNAAPHLREALRLDPGMLLAKTNLDRLLTEHPELR